MQQNRKAVGAYVKDGFIYLLLFGSDWTDVFGIKANIIFRQPRAEGPAFISWLACLAQATNAILLAEGKKTRATRIEQFVPARAVTPDRFGQGPGRFPRVHKIR